MSVTRRRHCQCRISDLERRSCSSLFTSAMPKKLAVSPSCIRRSGNTIPDLKPLNSLQENRLRILLVLCYHVATRPGQLVPICTLSRRSELWVLVGLGCLRLGFMLSSYLPS